MVITSGDCDTAAIAAALQVAVLQVMVNASSVLVAERLHAKRPEL
jgi:hypothetical protein